jgi:hypothetical protein
MAAGAAETHEAEGIRVVWQEEQLKRMRQQVYASYGRRSACVSAAPAAIRRVCDIAYASRMQCHVSIQDAYAV